MKRLEYCKRVIILGMDGAGNFIRDTETPHLDEFLNRGILTYDAQAAFPTISAECWGSMLHGVVPDKHGLNNDRASTERFPLSSPYPSIFRLVREQLPDAKLASFTSWSPINEGIIEEGIGVHKVCLPDAELAEAAAAYFEEHPDVTLFFMQLDDPDAAGHAEGYGSDSPRYLEAITEADRLIGSVLARIERLGLAEDSLIMIVTDHGGGGASRYDHGSDHPWDKTVFWGCAGPGIAPGMQIPDLNITDMPAIVAKALNLKAPEQWDARLPETLAGV
ncbi:sulfatase-like hydrolase/transferase [Paenibacillus sp. HJL G12]|uniref:Sulfatase-like hydrolase/transferase n=1 Tax=Paenibacillus dendrobii TaxID=2691084 RepID=A0A7X3LJA0_9BACL|nr:alkaline phosphatase family protein [Paenibacillus dendrobii]MWV46025.1 sulfatase-like hydrolase/transferase [Paenibacillus dendrobii]